MTPPPEELRARRLAGLLPGRRRAEELAAVLDGVSPESGVSDEVGELVGVATALRSVPAAEPRPEYAASLRASLLEEAETLFGPEMQKLRVPPRAKGVRERRLVAAAAAVLMIGGTASVAAASQSALPGQALYPIKRGIEQARTEIASSPAGKGRILLAQAGDRLDEVASLVANPPAIGPQVSGTLGDFTSEARSGAGLLLGDYRSSGDRSTASAVRVFAARSMHRLDALAPDAPPSSKPAFAAAAVTMRNLDAQASRLCPTCAQSLPALRVPKLLLVDAEVQQALHDARSTPLDNSHPVVVPKSATGSAGGGTGASGSSGTSGGTTSTAPAQPAPSPSPSQSTGTTTPSLPNLLPSDSPTPTSGAGDLTGTVSGTLDGLDGAVSTLLPDPNGSDNLLP